MVSQALPPTCSFPMRAVLLAALTLCALLFAQASSAQELTATVDRNELAINETFNLTLRYSGDETGGQPDFHLLEQDFEILSRQQSNQYRVFNGKAESFVEWTLVLAPLKEGKVFVPSLHLHGQVSDAIPMTINKAGESPSGNNRQAFLEVELDKDKVYVQEQLLVKVRLYTTVGLHDIATDPLQIAGAHVEKVDEQRYERRINGVGHAVYELTYAVFPESSDELQIPALNYVAVTGRRDPFSLFNRNAQRIRLRSEPQTVQVTPKPDSYSGSHWLPAASLGLVQSWSKDPEEFKIGEPITRIITLRAEGLRAAQLPPLPELEIEGLKTYPDQPQQEDSPANNGITGNRIETTAIVATKPGEYQLPPITLIWWDTKTGRQRATQLPAFRFRVTGAAVIDSATSGTNLPGEVPAKPATQEVEPGFWQTIAIAAIASHLFWLLYLFHLPTNSTSRPIKDNQKKPTVRIQTKRLEQAIEKGNPAEIQSATISWLKTQWPELAGNTMSELNNELKLPPLQKLNEALQTALYTTPATPINRSQIKTLVTQISKFDSQVEVHNPKTDLPQLFP